MTKPIPHDAAAARARPALVLLDVRLPGRSGYEVLRELRETAGTTLPVILMSGERTEPFDRAAGLGLGADDYVAKPFDEEELLARVRRLIRAREREARDANLTAREHEVLRLLASGLGQAQIAEALVVSRKTVGTQSSTSSGSWMPIVAPRPSRSPTATASSTVPSSGRRRRPAGGEHGERPRRRAADTAPRFRRRARG